MFHNSVENNINDRYILEAKSEKKLIIGESFATTVIALLWYIFFCLIHFLKENIDLNFSMLSQCFVAKLLNKSLLLRILS